jgi:potassium efflux system protein
LATAWWVGGMLAIATLYWARDWLAKTLQASKWGTASGRLRHLNRRIILVLIWALPGPLAIAHVGWGIGKFGGSSDVANAVAAGAERTAWLLFFLLLLRGFLVSGRATRPSMSWPETPREFLDLAVRLAIVFTPLWFVSSALAADGMNFNSDPLIQAHHNSLGRLCFLVAVLSVLVIGRGLLNPERAVAKTFGTAYSSDRIARRARVAHRGLVIIASSAFVLALAGFYTTAYLLVLDTFKTVAWSILLMLLYFGLREWRLDRNTTDVEPPLGENIQTDFRVSRLIRFGLILVWIGGAFVIWSVAVPTLSFVKRVELLPEFKVALDRPPDAQRIPTIPEQTGAGGVPEVERQQAQQPTSPGSPAVPAPASAQQKQSPEKRAALYLSDVLLALFIGILISMLLGNIPVLLQFSLFRWRKFDRGGEYAVTTICRYLVLMIGILVVSGILGLNWSKVQWLAAALTFGIGFGLQEIFANFAAGLILLVDRSIRVGDVVTVGNLSGVVSRIQTRATTVTLWDRSEMVVPNKEFITSKLVNWTRSNPETRVDLKVGVAYGSDVERVREVLMRVAKTHPAVLKQPPPQALLTGFAESAINFELQVFGMYTYGRPVLLDELHRSVMKEFEKENIIIAFPQLDVHLNAAGIAAQAGSQ